MDSSVIIVIPVYKKNLDGFEKISLKQLFSMLKKYAICLMAPTGFVLDYDELRDKEYQIEYFDGCWFRTVRSYSDLLLSKTFYERFSDYEYILIHQLDCFVFRDNLNEFCGMGYDYIGAPIHQKEGFWSEYHVGNGGLSLRKVKTTIELLKHKTEVFSEHPFPDQLCKAEDVFFSYCGANEKYDFSVPSVEIADRFSLFVDSDEKKKSVCENGLPFGIHYFPTYYYEFWRPFIQIFGYTLPVRPSDEKDRRYLLLMNQWIINKQNCWKTADYLNKHGYHNIAVYGMSIYGRHLLRELDGEKIRVEYCLDQNVMPSYMNISVISPNDYLKPVDAIINTVIWDHESISGLLRKKIDCPIISLEEIVFEGYWQ